LEHLPNGLLFGLLALLLIVSAFFSGSETAILSLNRYRLRHRASEGDKTASRLLRMLGRPDRLLGVILIGNNFVNILAASIATILSINLLGEAGLLSTLLLTLVVLIFAEVTPKTLAAVMPEKVSFPASLVLPPLLRLLYPAVWLVNVLSNGLLRLLRIKVQGDEHHLNLEELRTVVHESNLTLPQRSRDMLLGIMDLDKIRVEDIMIPRNEVIGINLEDDLDSITAQLRNARHTRVPVWKGDINNILGILHTRKLGRLLNEGNLNRSMLLRYTREPYFVPNSTPLQLQLKQFQKVRRRIGVVVDEYGDVEGLVTLEDILEEIVGEFTTDASAATTELQPQEDGSYLADASASIRQINREMGWSLPMLGARTLNGMLSEAFETIPPENCCIEVEGYRFEVLKVQDNTVRTLRISLSQDTALTTSEGRHG
jgi:Mg2+/Co2+ transporter CorB